VFSLSGQTRRDPAVACVFLARAALPVRIDFVKKGSNDLGLLGAIRHAAWSRELTWLLNWWMSRRDVSSGLHA
jgi:hypothetical protein